MKVVAQCQEEVEWLMQLSTMSSHTNMHLQLFLFHHVLHEVGLSVSELLYYLRECIGASMNPPHLYHLLHLLPTLIIFLRCTSACFFIQLV